MKIFLRWGFFSTLVIGREFKQFSGAPRASPGGQASHPEGLKLTKIRKNLGNVGENSEEQGKGNEIYPSCPTRG